MWIPLALFVGLLVATAVIAHVADNLGKKLGKKRVSLFGLRPRTSATLATVGSSWLIMIFTLAVLLAVVAPLRNALFHYESERARLTELAQKAQERAQIATEQARRAQQAVAGLQRKSEGLQSDVTKFQGNARKSQQEAYKYQVQAKEFQGQAQSAQENLQTARRGEQSARRGAQVAQRTAQIAQVSARNAQATANNARKQKEAVQKALGAAQRGLQLVQVQLDIKQTSLVTAQKKLDAANARLAKAKDQIVKSYAQVVKSYAQVATAQGQVEASQKQVNQARKEVNDLKTQKDDLQKQVGFYGSLAYEFRGLSQELAYGDISLPVDQVLAERRLDATRSPEDISRELLILVELANAQVRKQLHKDKLDFTVATAVTNKSGEQIQLNAKETIEFFSTLLSTANQTFSIRLVSAFNYPSTTTSVIARFVPVPIRTIYLARQDIVEGAIDPGKSESAVFGQLQRLVDSARSSAERNGARPPVIDDPDTPTYFFDGDTGPKMFEALREVQKYDHPVQVRIVAARDLDSAEPLQIRFLVGDQA